MSIGSRSLITSLLCRSLVVPCAILFLVDDPPVVVSWKPDCRTVKISKSRSLTFRLCNIVDL